MYDAGSAAILKLHTLSRGGDGEQSCYSDISCNLSVEVSAMRYSVLDSKGRDKINVKRIYRTFWWGDMLQRGAV